MHNECDNVYAHVEESDHGLPLSVYSSSHLLLDCLLSAVSTLEANSPQIQQYNKYTNQTNLSHLSGTQIE